MDKKELAQRSYSRYRSTFVRNPVGRESCSVFPSYHSKWISRTVVQPCSSTNVAAVRYPDQGPSVVHMGHHLECNTASSKVIRENLISLKLLWKYCYENCKEVAATLNEAYYLKRSNWGTIMFSFIRRNFHTSLHKVKRIVRLLSSSSCTVQQQHNNLGKTVMH